MFSLAEPCMLEIFPSPEHLAVDKVIVAFRKRIISNSTYPRNTKIKIYKLCDMPGHTQYGCLLMKGHDECHCT
jgi:hypothetical protein